MPSLNVAFAWATPIDVAKLGPHLEAYVNLQPTINTIRLCRRFGGSDAPITRLPVELLNEIEEFLVEAERDKKCSVMDHYSDDDMDDICAEMDEAGIEEMTPSEFLAEHDGHYDIHFERMGSWAPGVSALSDYEPIFKKNFGLSVWTSAVRLDAASQGDPYFASEATLAYLRLPAAPCISTTMEISELESDCSLGDITIETGCAVDISKQFRGPDDTDARFKRAMMVLSLKACEHESQRSHSYPTKIPSDKVAETEAEGRKIWPRLMTLVNTKA